MGVYGKKQIYRIFHRILLIGFLGYLMFLTKFGWCVVLEVSNGCKLAASFEIEDKGTLLEVSYLSKPKNSLKLIIIFNSRHRLYQKY